MASAEKADLLARGVVGRLKEVRLRKKLSLRELEKLCGISNGGIHQIESGEIRSPTVYTLSLITWALGLKLHEVIKEVEQSL